MLFKFLRYNLVQVAAYGIELSTFFGMLWIWPGYLIMANVSAKTAAGCFAFFLHKYFTFKSSGKHNIGGEAGRYVLILIGNMVLGSLLLVFLVGVMPEWGSKLMSDVISVGITFLLTHYLVFSVPNSDEDFCK
ncbi:GtrA family protein [Mariprofundus ferrooxydans]|uniref:GtrA family protein n=1 Tax=Mariprofundus ferrooxydans TaxID=314344 RepID=UPI0014306256|nr:GtrA family protein [Mariprofundus ferrooxydans]